MQQNTVFMIGDGCRDEMLNYVPAKWSGLLCTMIVYPQKWHLYAVHVCIVKYSETHNNSEHQTEYTVLQEKRQWD